jgi:hypothetical protein
MINKAGKGIPFRLLKELSRSHMTIILDLRKISQYHPAFYSLQ